MRGGPRDDIRGGVPNILPTRYPLLPTLPTTTHPHVKKREAQLDARRSSRPLRLSLGVPLGGGVDWVPIRPPAPIYPEYSTPKGRAGPRGQFQAWALQQAYPAAYPGCTRVEAGALGNLMTQSHLAPWVGTRCTHRHPGSPRGL